MKYVFVNPLELLSTLYHAGEISVEDINQAIGKPRTLNYPCGFNYNEHNQSYSLFFHTDKETKKIKWAGKDKNCVQLNIQPNQKAKKQQAAQTPGIVLPQTAGTPELTPEVIATLAALGITLPAQPEAQVAVQQSQQAKEAVDEADFGDIDITL